MNQEQFEIAKNPQMAEEYREILRQIEQMRRQFLREHPNGVCGTFIKK